MSYTTDEKPQSSSLKKWDSASSVFLTHKRAELERKWKMSRDCSQLVAEIGDIEQAAKRLSPNAKYAARVEAVVAAVCDVPVTALVKKWRNRGPNNTARARFIVMSILWQPYGFRSLPWLARRYGIADHTIVRYGIERVEMNHNGLKEVQLRCMDIIVTQLETEMFGSPRKEEFYADCPL